MIQIGEIDPVVLWVIDSAAMQRFYVDVLGCREKRRQDAVGLGQLRAARSLIDLVAVDSQLGRHGGAVPAADGDNMDHLCLRVENFDEAMILAHLRAHGVRIGERGSRYGAQGQGPSIYLYDPPGNLIELKGRPSLEASRLADFGPARKSRRSRGGGLTGFSQARKRRRPA